MSVVERHDVSQGEIVTEDHPVQVQAEADRDGQHGASRKK